ncbi:MAG: response regulator transcription factor [Treponema sp.]|jgi:DNA-binding NarL/FixJ family response regulator|nr:response regulator transcription factor [Treponema sp.]
MNRGTLLVSRAIKLHTYFKTQLEALGFKDITITAAEKDGLNMLINDLKPRLVLVGAGFYKCCTPYMISLLLRQFPNLNIAVISLFDYPADYCMKFIANGVKSCVLLWDGIEQFYQGLDCVKDGKSFISVSVMERIELRQELPEPARELTERQIEVIRELCNGFSVDESADNLAISSRTVDAHKRDIYIKLNVRSENELIRAAQFLKVVDLDELTFFGGNFELPPEIKKTPKLRRVK